MSVTIELASDRVGVSGDDGIEVRTPHPHTVYMARRDVTQDVNLEVIQELIDSSVTQRERSQASILNVL